MTSSASGHDDGRSSPVFDRPNLIHEHKPLQRKSSMEYPPTDMSELRLVLLGNSRSQRCSVGDFIMGYSVLNKKEASIERIRGRLKEKPIVLINTPDLLCPSINKHKQEIETIARLSAPGPHVFLLVLQPEDFTEVHKEKLCRILQTFSDQSFDHSLVLISSPNEGSSVLVDKYMEQPPLKEMINKCKNRYLNMKDIKQSELFAQLDQMAKENNGQHINQRACQAATPTLTVSRFRIVLLGKSDDKQAKLKNFIIRDQSFHSQIYFPVTPQASSDGEWRGKTVTVMKLPNIFSLSVEDVIRQMKRLETLCPPGPNVLLLLVNPSDFTEEKRQTLKFILSLFGPDAFRHSMVIKTHEGNEMNQSVEKLLEDCRGRHHNMSDHDRDTLMEKIQMIVNGNRGSFLTFTGETRGPKSEDIRPALNLVLCGRRGSGKTSAAEAILDDPDLHSVSDSSHSVKHQGEVRGRWVSLVELPALYGKPQQEVMEEALRCVSLCEPEGVHAFIMVLPVGPLTDEDKGELETIQETLSSRVNDSMMILFTVESDPTAPAVINFMKETKEIQDLCQSCGGRYVVLNIKDKQQVPELFDTVKKMPVEGSRCFTREALTKALITKLVVQQRSNALLQAELQDIRQGSEVRGDDEHPSKECLRMVLLGKTGNGKSATGNTILKHEHFESKNAACSMTSFCEKATGDIDGQPVIIVDTPGLFDTSRSNDFVQRELVSCISLLSPGPHALLLVLQIDRFTPEERQSVELIKDCFGEKAVDFIFIIFTKGDQLTGSIEEYIRSDKEGNLRRLINECGGRYQVFNNKDLRDRTQVRGLAKKLNKMVKENGGRCFTSEMFKEAEAAIQKEVTKIMKEKEEEMQRQKEELQRKHEEEIEAVRKRMEKQEEEIQQLRDRQLEDIEKSITKEKEERAREQLMREEEDAKRRSQEHIQRLEWERKIRDLEERTLSESEKTRYINRELVLSREALKRERESWEKERKEEWEKRKKEDEQKRQEEETTIRSLQEIYYMEREKHESQRREEETNRRQQEERERIKLEENYTIKLVEMKTCFEEEARKKAEEFNEFKEKYIRDVDDLTDKHKKEVEDLKSTHNKEYGLLDNLSREKVKNLKEDMETLKKTHSKEINELKKKYKDKCFIQ